jgi:hypothetical protein
MKDWLDALLVGLVVFAGADIYQKRGDAPGPSTATAAVYVYEKDDTAPTNGVQSAINRLNREKKILACLFEEDTVDGTGETPYWAKVPLAEAQKAGLPALVVTNGERVVNVVKAPTTEEQVFGAVR